MTRLRRFPGPLALSMLLASAAVAAPRERPPATAPPVAMPSPADLTLAALQSKTTRDDAAAHLVDRARTQPASALECAAGLLLLDRNDDALHVLLTAGRNDEALDLLAGSMRVDEALALPFAPADLTGQAMRAGVLARLGLRDEAMSSALSALDGSTPARSRVFAGAIFADRRLEAEAAWTWLVRRAGVTSPTEALLSVRAILDPTQSSKDADALLRDAPAVLSTATPCEEARLGAGLVALARSRHDDDAALAIARAWSAGNGEAAWLTLADLLADRKAFGDAAAAYGRAADVDPKDGAIRWVQGSMLRSAGDLAGASRAFATAREAATTPCATARLAHAMRASGDRAEGDALLATLAKPDAGEDPRVVAASSSPLVFGRVLPLVRGLQARELKDALATKDFDAALALADHADEPFLTNVDATVDLAAALRDAGRSADADALVGFVRARMSDALASRPSSARLLNADAWLSARLRVDLGAAVKNAERAAALEPANAGILDTLAEARFQSGDRAGALDAARRALALQPDRAYFQRQVERMTGSDPRTTSPPLSAEGADMP